MANVGTLTVSYDPNGEIDKVTGNPASQTVAIAKAFDLASDTDDWFAPR